MTQVNSTLPGTGPVAGGGVRTRRKTRDSTRWRESVIVAGLRIGIVAVICAFWQLSPNSVVPADAVGKPTGVAEGLWNLTRTGALPSALGWTLLTACYALVIGAVAGLAVGTICSTKVGRWLLQPAVTMIYAIPKVGLLSVYVILLGVGRSAHVALVVSAVLFVYLYGIQQGIDDVSADQLNAMRGMGASSIKVFWSLTLPSAVPQLLGATRIALPLALTSEIFAELREPTVNGLGTLLADSSQDLQGADATAVLIVTVVVAYVLDIFLQRQVHGYTHLTGTGMQV
jgi:ABC-type nitrate/sulfonate/bicarbonate transport system permease component